MSLSELTGIVDKGCDFARLTVEGDQKRRISRLSEGLPHYTHLLCLHAAQRTVQEDRDSITEEDVETAIALAVEKHTIRSEYQQAVRSTKKDSLFPEVLLACALAPKLELGYFAAGAVREPLSKIRNKEVEIASYVRHLNKFTDIRRGGVLHQVGEKRGFFYRFANPLLQPYVILNGLSQGLITDELLLELQRENGQISDPTTEPQPLF
jgi:hypothetical protein